MMQDINVSRSCGFGEFPERILLMIDIANRVIGGIEFGVLGKPHAEKMHVKGE